MCWSVLPTFSSMRFSVVALCWGFWSIWTWVLCMVIAVDLFSFFYVLMSSYTSNIHWICFLFSIIYIFCFFGKNQVFVGVWIDIWVFNSVPLIFLSVFMSIPGWFQYFSSSSKVLSQELWYLKKFLYCPGLFRLSCFWSLFVCFCFSIWSWVLYF